MFIRAEFNLIVTFDNNDVCHVFFFTIGVEEIESKILRLLNHTS